MAERDSTPDTPVPPSKTYHKAACPPPNPELTQELTELDDGLYRLLCVLQFYRESMENVTAQNEPTLTTEWHYGAHLLGEWMSETGEGLRQRVERMRPVV